MATTLPRTGGLELGVELHSSIGSVVESQRPRSRALCAFGLATLAAILIGSVNAAPPERVVSINLCTDQLVLGLARPAQILALSWLASDPQESAVWERARRFPTNHGSVEELLTLDPDLIVAGRYTATFSKSLLTRLGYPVLEITPADSLADIYRNVRLVAAALDRTARGDLVIAEMRAQIARFEAQAPPTRRAAIIVQPGGFTVGANSVAHELLRLAGFENRAVQMGLDRWGSLSLEALLSSGAQRLIVARYRADVPSLANEFVAHRVFRRLQANMELVSIPASLFACGVPQSLEAVALMRKASAESSF